MGLRLALLVAVVAAATAAVAVAAGSGDGAAARRVEIDIRFSRFAPAEVRVPAGVAVTFAIRNLDPISHEWIVGDAAVHDRHRTGTEPVHGQRPTEVSIGIGATVETTITFAEPGRYRFVCHLPGHEAYGMTGLLIVEP